MDRLNRQQFFDMIERRITLINTKIEKTSTPRKNSKIYSLNKNGSRMEIQVTDLSNTRGEYAKAEVLSTDIKLRETEQFGSFGQVIRWIDTPLQYLKANANVQNIKEIPSSGKLHRNKLSIEEVLRLCTMLHTSTKIKYRVEAFGLRPETSYSEFDRQRWNQAQSLSRTDYWKTASVSEFKKMLYSQKGFSGNVKISEVIPTKYGRQYPQITAMGKDTIDYEVLFSASEKGMIDTIVFNKA